MIYLLYTNAVSDLMKSHPLLNRRMDEVAPTDKVITVVIVVGEILYGLERLPLGKRRAALEGAAKEVLTALTSIAVPTDASSHYAKTKTELTSRGLALDENDLWIAATALSVGATLVDTDFANVTGLTVQNWTV